MYADTHVWNGLAKASCIWFPVYLSPPGVPAPLMPRPLLERLSECCVAGVVLLRLGVVGDVYFPMLYGQARLPRAGLSAMWLLMPLGRPLHMWQHHGSLLPLIFPCIFPAAV
jgi:hypothetical protein